MYYINKTLDTFIDALQQKNSIVLKSTGYWRYRGAISSLLEKILGREEQHLIDLTKAFIDCLDRLENIPVRFSLRSRPAEQEIDYRSFILASKFIENMLAESTTPEGKKQFYRLKRRIYGLLYRIEEPHGGSKTLPVDEELLNKLKLEAIHWKRTQKIFWDNKLTHNEIRLLEEACHYRKVVHLLFDAKELRNTFFTWTIRDGVTVAPFMEFPSLAEKIVDCELTGRIGRFGGKGLKVKKEPIPGETYPIDQKILTLPFEGRDISILDMERTVLLRGNYPLTIREIFDFFKHQFNSIGNVEFLPQGIVNWNTNELGWWNNETKKYEVIDLEKPHWWLQLPIIEVLTHDQAKMRYGHHMDGWHWNIAAKASREDPSLQVVKTHAYLEIAIPTEDGGYAIYDFGKYAIDQPASRWQWITFFTATGLAAIRYPDENVFLTNRQHAGYSFELTPNQGKKCMETIRQDIMRARQGHLAYQFEAENCGSWIQDILDEHLGSDRVPNLFRMPFINVVLHGPLKYITEWVRRLPEFLQTKVLAVFHYLMGGWRGRWVVDNTGKKIWVSLRESEIWDDQDVYHPAYLHKQREIGSLAEEPNRQIHYLRKRMEGKDATAANKQTPDNLYTLLDLFNEKRFE